MKKTLYYVPSKGWAEMIRKLYEVDLLLCPCCGGNFTQTPKPECGYPSPLL